MLDVEMAVNWSRERLEFGGYFVMDDFIGPSRFQWSDYEIAIASRVRELLPARFLSPPPPLDPDRPLSARVSRPSIEGMISADPTEAADSGNILLSVNKVFPNAEIISTGGVIYQLALNDVLAHFDDVDDQPLLSSLLLLDETLANNGYSHYAVAFAQNLKQ